MPEDALIFKKSKNGLMLEANLLTNGSFFLKIRYLFIFQVGTLTRRQRSDLFGFRASCHLLLPV